MAPIPKPRETRQRWAKRPEVGIVKVDPADKPVIPLAPKGLTTASKKRWRTFWLSPLASVVEISTDLHRVERWIQAVDEYEKVGKVFRSSRLVKGSTGQPVLNPLASYLASLEATISRAEQELGMTPLARLKLGIAVGQAKLTAEALNKSLSEAGQDRPQIVDAEAWEAEWQEA